MKLSEKELELFKSLLSTSNKKDIAEQAVVSVKTVYAVLDGYRSNSLVEMLCYEKAKANWQKVGDAFLALEKKIDEDYRTIKNTEDLKDLKK